jgi:hypothetical protein
MASVLSLVFVLSLPVFIGCVVAYLVAVNSYWKLVARDMPEAWAGARARGRPSESWMATAYRSLREHRTPPPANEVRVELTRARRTALRCLYASLTLFLVLLFAGLSLDAMGAFG